MIESAPSGKREVTVTTKYGGGYDAPWVVFRGSRDEVREDMRAWFGLEGDEAVNMDGHDLLSGVWGALKGSGGGSGRGRGSRSPQAAPEPVAALSAGPEVKVAVETNADLLERVKAAASRDELTALWKANKNEWDGPVGRAAKARAEELDKESN